MLGNGLVVETEKRREEEHPPLRIEPPIYRRRVDFFTKSRAFDTTRARTELGFEPKVDLQQGIHRTATWYKSQGLL